MTADSIKADIMTECGCGRGATAVVRQQARVLIIVLLINAVMFVVEATAGVLAKSSALLADSLDMLGDALVYGFSLYVVARGTRWKAASALIKGTIQLGITIALLFLRTSFGVIGRSVSELRQPA